MRNQTIVRTQLYTIRKEKEKRLDDSCQHIKTPVGKDVMTVSQCARMQR